MTTLTLLPECRFASRCHDLQAHFVILDGPTIRIMRRPGAETAVPPQSAFAGTYGPLLKPGVVFSAQTEATDASG
jgi:hypothetical protein